MRRHVLIWGALCLATLLPTHSEAADSVAAQLAKLDAAYASITTLTASFTQESRFAGFGKARVFGGTLELQRPDRMRWDYSNGSDQQIYVAGRQVTLYAPQSKQAIVSKLSPSSDSQIPLHLLADVSGIRDTYLVTAGADGELLLTPIVAHSTAPSAIHLWVDDNGLIARVQLIMPGGNRSDIRFTQRMKDTDIDPERFLFHAPEGVYVVHPKSLFPQH